MEVQHYHFGLTVPDSSASAEVNAAMSLDAAIDGVIELISSSTKGFTPSSIEDFWAKIEHDLKTRSGKESTRELGWATALLGYLFYITPCLVFGCDIQNIDAPNPFNALGDMIERARAAHIHPDDAHDRADDAATDIIYRLGGDNEDVLGGPLKDCTKAVLMVAMLLEPKLMELAFPEDLVRIEPKSEEADGPDL